MFAAAATERPDGVTQLPHKWTSASRHVSQVVEIKRGTRLSSWHDGRNRTEVEVAGDPMKKTIFLTLLTLALAVPAFSQDERHQSFISYDDGGTIVRSDGREIEGRRNLPIFPADEIITARRGRAEVRMSDGNIIGIDRATSLQVQSVVDAYEGDADETVMELRYGKVAVYRTDLGRDHVRLDTENASYVAQREAIYSVETESGGSDRVTVFEGSVEVRTPSRATRLRRGESAQIDDRGMYDLVSDEGLAADDFDRWFLQRSERFDSRSTRYVDNRLSYWTDDLDAFGSWVYINGIGYSWRPMVAVGWRPYYNGYWYHSRNGYLNWVSYDPWGWGPYHYGRWSYDPFYGWVWVPGYGYSPAWVYWMTGPGYIGWAPSGWWDCYRPYYDWAYRSYRNTADFGFGFYGRVRLNEIDLRPWTFVDSVGLISTRVDRAALTADAVKQRLGRTGGGLATVAGGAPRLTNEDLRDPAEAIRRRALDGKEGRLTGSETGAPPTDLTPFFGRQASVEGSIRDRIVRGRSASSGSGSGSAPVMGGGVSLPTPAVIDRRETTGRGSIGRGGSAGSIDRGTTGSADRGSSGAIGRGAGTSGGTGGAIQRGGSAGDRGGSIDRGGSSGSSGGSRSTSGSSGRIRSAGRGRSYDSAPSSGSSESSSESGSTPIILRGTRTGGDDPGSSTSTSRDSWRGRPASGVDAPSASSGTSGSTSRTGASDVPRRVIDRIGGARIYPRDSSSSRSGSGSSSSSGRSSGSTSRPPRIQSGSGGWGSSGSSSGSSSGGSRSSGGSSSSAPSSSGSSSSGGGHRSGGGEIKRDNH
jgi:hypothetical protein